jgi:flagellar hook-associated protein 1 FlgK
MSSAFGGYSVALTGMAVNQTVLATISHNLANISTTGYSRQQVSTAELVTKQSGGTTTGSGTSAESVTRARNTLLDQTYRTENATLSYCEAKSSNIETVESLLGDFTVTTDDSTTETGIQKTLQDFFVSWDELGKDPSSSTARETVLAAANTLVDTLAELDEQLQQLQEDCVSSVQVAVDNLNSYASQVAALNRQIVQAEVGGATANDLRDQRDELVDKMSALADVTTNEDANGTFSVNLGGVSLVQGDSVNTVAVSGDGSTTNPLKLIWTELNREVTLSAGSIAAQIEDADQSMVTALTYSSTTSMTDYAFDADSCSTIGEVRQALNNLITTIAYQVNALVTSGTDLDGNAGVEVFVSIDSSHPLSISNMQVNSVLDDANKLAVSSTGETGDGTIASSISALQNATNLVFDGLNKTPNSFYTSLVSWLGTEGETVDGLVTTQNSLVSQIDTQRQSVSSVSLDEELSKMIAYQSAYAASAKYLSTIDNLLAGLIAEIQ